jgi:AhpD family alkylhydroperoxidase
MRIAIDQKISAKNFSAFKDNPSLQESAQLFAQGLPVAEMIQAFSMNENVLRSFAGFDAIYPHGNLERSILEKVILRVSQINECQFCVNSHIDIMTGLGIAPEADAKSASNTEREKLAIEYAEAMKRDSNRVPDELFARLKKAFSDSEIVELTFHVGFINMLNMFNNTMQVRYKKEFDGMEIR